MNADSFLVLMAVMFMAMALTLILFSCLWARSLEAPVNRRKRRLELGRLLQCSHPEWN